MDAVEFFNTISEMCKEGAKTEYYKEKSATLKSKYGKNQGQEINWDILTVFENFISDFSRMEGVIDDDAFTLDKYWRDTISHTVESEELYPAYQYFDIELFNKDVKLALLGYLYSIKDTFYDDTKDTRRRTTEGWYIGGMSDDEIAIPELLDEDFKRYLSLSRRLIIGYRGMANNSFDLHFAVDGEKTYYNINHSESFRGQLAFDLVLQKGMNFMNWRGVPF